VNMSGRIITNERPCGSQVMISVSVGSLRISMSFCGKMSFFFNALESVGLLSSSITTGRTTAGAFAVIGAVSAVRAVAASMRLERLL